MFSQSTKLQRVPLFATLNLQLEIKDHTPDALELMLPLLGTPKMEAELELDFHQGPEKLFLEAVEPLLVSLQVEAEMKSLS